MLLALLYAIPLLQLVIALIVIGVASYLVQLIPMDATIKKVITVLVILLVVVYALQLLWPGMALR